MNGKSSFLNKFQPIQTETNVINNHFIRPNNFTFRADITNNGSNLSNYLVLFFI